MRYSLNPENPVTNQLDTEWHKLLAIVMHKQGLRRVTIRTEDLDLLTQGDEMQCIIAHAHRDSIDLILTTEAGARTYAREHGNRLLRLLRSAAHLGDRGARPTVDRLGRSAKADIEGGENK